MPSSTLRHPITVKHFKVESLNLPGADLRLRDTEAGKTEVYDPLRRKYVAMVPEEFVRQHFVNYLIKYLGYPASHVANEVSLTLNTTRRRCDTLVYNAAAQPLMIVEYKAPYVSIDQETFDQIVRYNMVLNAKYLVVSNGLRHFCCRIDYADRCYSFLPQIPSYASIKE